MNGACEGLSVLDFSSWMAGPLATMILADCGAEVIKVEPPAGDPARRLPAFHTWNRGKRSVIADLSSVAGKDRALELAARADVVVIGFRPGVAERFGIDYESIRILNPGIIYADITGFGTHGAYSHLKGYEALVAAKSGRMTVYQGIAPRKGPAYLAVPLASFSAAMLVTQGILAALHSRRQTGLGQRVSVSMLTALLPYDLHTWILHQQQSPTDPATSAARSRAYDPRQMHRPDFRVPRPSIWPGVTKDGEWLWFENTAQHLCAAQMSALDLVDLYADERFVNLPVVANEDDAEELWGILLGKVRSKTAEEWTAILDNFEIGVERVQWPVNAFRHRQVVHNRHVTEILMAENVPMQQPGPLVRFSKTTHDTILPAPHLGGDNDYAFSSKRQNRGESRGSPQKNGPLSDTTILDLSTWYAGAYATSVLANLGARVIKVEPLGGDPGRYLIGGLLGYATSQGKESLAVNLKSAEGMKIVRGLVRKVDALYHNFRADVAERLRLNYASVRRLNPEILYVHASAYGDSGPDRRRPAFMGSVAAATGYTLRQVGFGHPPTTSAELDMAELKKEAWRLARTAEGNADVNSALAAATAVLLGLCARDAGAGGQNLMTTMLCSNMYLNSDELIDYPGCPPPLRADENLYGVAPAYRMYKAGDGWVFLACLMRDEWDALCQVAGRDDLRARWPDAWQPIVSSRQAQELAQELSTVFLAHSAASWESLMSQEDVPLVEVETRDPGQFFLESQQLVDERHRVHVDSVHCGPYWRHGALQLFSRDGGTFGAFEPVGAHSRPILEELGYSRNQADRLIATGVVEGSDAAT